MSQYYQVGDEVLWNPSNGVSGLFLRTAAALGPEAGVPSGLGEMDADECQVDVAALAEFVGALRQRRASSNHLILHALMDGFIATATVLVERGGGTVPEPVVSGEWRDFQVGRGPAAEEVDWQARSREHARAMAR